MSPEEYAHKISVLMEEVFEETGWYADFIDGNIVLAKFDEDTGRTETISIIY